MLKAGLFMLLNDEPKLFFELINKTSLYFNIRVDYVEKDYWLVLLLKHIMSKNQGYVFKGGTSLSKCYKLINRFSEDIDISYSTPFGELACTDINRKFKGISNSINEIGLSIENKEHLRRNAYFNRYICPYQSIFNEPGINKAIIVELAGQTPSFPLAKMPIQTFIGEYLHAAHRDDLIKEYELDSFEIEVQSLSRTIVDKTFALCDYYLSKRTERNSRHIYDIHKILPFITLNEEIKKLFLKVRSYRQQLPICLSSRDGIKLSELFEKLIFEETFKNDYESLTKGLLYDKVKYKDCVDSLNTLLTFLKENNL